MANKILDDLIAAKVPSETIIAVAKLIADAEMTQARRARNRERMTSVRARAHTRVHTETPPSPLNGSLSPNKEKSPTPPKEINPLTPLNPPIPTFATMADGSLRSPSPCEEKFNEFKQGYPKRDGSNPWTPARKKFMAAMKSGVDSEAMISGAKRYSEECREKKLVGTPMVAQAVTWLNQQRWLDYAPDPPPKPRPKPTAEQLEERRRSIEIGEKILKGELFEH